MKQFYETHKDAPEILSTLAREIAPKAENVFRDHYVMEFVSGEEAKPKLEDYKFIERRISQQYLNLYNDTYAFA